jgi:uncharacterized RDD family membrane protein YckC
MCKPRIADTVSVNARRTTISNNGFKLVTRVSIGHGNFSQVCFQYKRFQQHLYSGKPLAPWYIFRVCCSFHVGSEQKELIIAKWSDRFVAWLIDFIVVGAVSEAVFTVFALPFAFRFPNLDFNDAMNTAFASVLQVRSVVFLAYWTYFESTSGQSLGKKVMNLKVVDMNGNVPKPTMVFFQALGKAFILALDVIIGWIFLSEDRQRLLNKLTDTLVIKAKPVPPGIKLVKEDE